MLVGTLRDKKLLVVKGYVQKSSFDSVRFSFVVRMNTSVGYATVPSFEVEQFEVKPISLYGNLDDEIYRFNPKGFIQKNKEKMLYLLPK